MATTSAANGMPFERCMRGECDAACLIDGNHLLFVQEGSHSVRRHPRRRANAAVRSLQFTVLDDVRRRLKYADFGNCCSEMSYADPEVRPSARSGRTEAAGARPNRGYRAACEAVDRVRLSGLVCRAVARQCSSIWRISASIVAAHCWSSELCASLPEGHAITVAGTAPDLWSICAAGAGQKDTSFVCRIRRARSVSKGAAPRRALVRSGTRRCGGSARTRCHCRQPPQRWGLAAAWSAR